MDQTNILTMLPRPKIVLFGGAFDPITIGHLTIAYAVMEKMNPDELWISPCYKHSFGKELTNSHDRITMCEIAVRHNKYGKKLHVSYLEIGLQMDRPTYYTLQELFSIYKTHMHEFSMIIGIDNANSFHKWVEYKKLQELIPFIVVSRSGVERDKSVDWYMKPPHVFLEFPYDPVTDISSTKVREMVAAGESIEGKVPPGVDEYIKVNGLYQKNSS